MRIDYTDNSFMLAWGTCRAWYDSEGRLKDAEYKRSHGRVVSVSQKHVKVRAWLEKQGFSEANLLNRGILKRKYLSANSCAIIHPCQAIEARQPKETK